MKSKLRLLFVVFASALLASNLPSATAATGEAEKEAILALISRMEAAWNRGDFRGYMEGFANPNVIFVSRGQFQKDWQGTLDHYVRDYGASEATRGRLRFFDIQIEMLAPDTAQLISRYQLDRPENPQDGINTRLMRKRGDKWVIALNHVSSREVPEADGAQASANEGTQVEFPEGYRLWSHVKSGVIGREHKNWASLGGFQHIYANANALEGYRTRQFPEGSVIAFDWLEMSEKDGAFVEGPRRQVDVMVKDSKRFAATGGWGFQRFLKGSGSERASSPSPQQCFACHQSLQKDGLVLSHYRP